MLQGPDRSASRSRRSGKGTRGNRANTTPQPLPDYLKNPNYQSPFADNNNNGGLATINDNTNAKASSDDIDLLDLFSSFSSANSGASAGSESGTTNTNDDFMNPFAASAPNPSTQQGRPKANSDFFVGTNPFGLKNRVNNNNNNNSSKNSNNNNSNDLPSANPSFNNAFASAPVNSNNDPFADFGFTNDNKDEDEKEVEKKQRAAKEKKQRPSEPPPAKSKKKGKKAKSRQVRASTEATVQTMQSPPSTTAPKPPGKSKTKTKSIDVLPLLHTGVKANKFKFGQNKSKVRTFYLTKDNQWFCWEPAGGMLQSKPNRSKIDPQRSVMVRTIKKVMKNSASKVQGLNFIPDKHKGLTISIQYSDSNGGPDKQTSLMAYEPFHHVMIYEALQKLSTMGQNINRDLGNVFELYVEFEKEILPKHLRPQRFKWEPLGANEIAANKNKDDDDESGKHSPNGNGVDMEVFDPTQDTRDRMKSF